MKKCLDCGKECKACALRCVPCGNAKHLARSKEKKVTQMKSQLNFCPACENYFHPYRDNQTFCTNECKEKDKNAKINANWLKKKKIKPSPSSRQILPPSSKECEIWAT